MDLILCLITALFASFLIQSIKNLPKILAGKPLIRPKKRDAGFSTGEIQYGFDGYGGWGPIKIGDKDVQYGLDGHGGWGPIKIGEEDIQYGFDGHGGWGPIQIGDKEIRYGFNGHGGWGANNIQKFK